MDSIKNKITAVFISIVLCAAVLGTSLYIAEETDHNCSGNNCSVCTAVKFFETIVRELAAAEGAAAIQTAALFILAVRIIFIIKQLFFRETLISLKVELLN